MVYYANRIHPVKKKLCGKNVYVYTERELEFSTGLAGFAVFAESIFFCKCRRTVNKNKKWPYSYEGIL